MTEYTRFVGLDVHKDSIVLHEIAANGEEGGSSTIANHAEVIGKSMRRIAQRAGGRERVRCCYEAGACGYTLYRQLEGMGISCSVVAPSLTPVKPGDRVKTDRRDARKLARLERAGELTPVWVPGEEYEGLRDLVRAREGAKQNLLRARHKLSKYLLRHGIRAPEGASPWRQKFELWLNGLSPEDEVQRLLLAEYRHEIQTAQAAVERLETMTRAAAEKSRLRGLIEGLQVLRGVSFVTAATLAVEIGDITRFSEATQLMSYVGLTPSEHSSGVVQRRGRITKMGNSHLRWVLVEAAWHYRHKPYVGAVLKKRQQGQLEQAKLVSWKAQVRLHTRYRELMRRGKPRNQVVVAIARELCGFVWELAWVLKAQSLAQAC